MNNQYISINLKDSQHILSTISPRNGYSVVKTENIRTSVYNSHGKLVAFAPLSTSNIDSFFDSNGKILNDIRIEEYVEGTMINLFHDNNEWTISTRSTVGGRNNFYLNGTTKQKSFRTMFDECWKDQMPFSIDTLDKNYSYSLVMQHKDNRIINPVFENKLYLISVYRHNCIYEPGEIESYVHMVSNLGDYSEALGQKWNLFHYPLQYDSLEYDTKEKLISKFAAPFTDYNIMGVNLFNTQTGERAKLRNPAYEELKKLRGNQAKIEYHYMTLRKTGRVDEFLDFFPEYTEDFNLYESKIMNFQHELFENFQNCYIHRKARLGQFDPKFKSHMFILHDDYVKTNEPTNMNTVVNYTNNLAEAQLLAAVNYEMRKTSHKYRKPMNNETSFKVDDVNFPALMA